MENVARRFQDQANFAVVYTREAHSGQGAFVQYHDHRSLEERQTYASELREEFGMERLILLDTMESDVQRAYGDLPNAQLMIVQGRVVHATPWADAQDAEDWLRSQ